MPAIPGSLQGSKRVEDDEVKILDTYARSGATDSFSQKRPGALSPNIAPKISFEKFND